MKRIYISVIATCLIVTALFFAFYQFSGVFARRDSLKIGFIYDNDESTCYTYNFSLAKEALEKRYGDDVEILTRSNVPENEVEEPVRQLVAKGCELIFTNSYSEDILRLAVEYPNVEFCQVSYTNSASPNAPRNYHTFKGEIYQGRYVTGVIAGMKLRQLIEQGMIAPEEAKLGFVAAFADSEIISGFTAFLLGARSVVPEATMRVRYTGTWSSYSLEKRAAEALIDEGCLILSQHTDTVGPALACEEALPEKKVYFVGYNQSTQEIAPSVSLVATRVNWTPYITAATEAVMRYRTIEKEVPGRAHGNDLSAGFDMGWVEILGLNDPICAEGTREIANEMIDEFKHGHVGSIFRGDYIGIDPSDPGDTIDLKKGFEENAASSYPAFHWLLEDIVIIDN